MHDKIKTNENYIILSSSSKTRKHGYAMHHFYHSPVDAEGDIVDRLSVYWHIPPTGECIDLPFEHNDFPVVSGRALLPDGITNRYSHVRIYFNIYLYIYFYTREILMPNDYAKSK